MQRLTNVSEFRSRHNRVITEKALPAPVVFKSFIILPFYKGTKISAPNLMWLITDQRYTRKWISYASKVCNEATTVVQAGPRMITSK